MEYLTCEQVAEIAHCSIYHVRSEVKAGALMAYKPGKVMLFSQEEVKRWINASAINAKEAKNGQPEID